MKKLVWIMLCAGCLITGLSSCSATQEGSSTTDSVSMDSMAVDTMMSDTTMMDTVARDSM